MRLVSSERYLSLIRQALETSIIPELLAPAVRAKAEIALTAVSELLKRERDNETLLEPQIAAGAALVSELRDLLDQPVPASETGNAPQSATFDERLQTYTELNQQIAELSASAAKLRSKPDRAEHQDAISSLLQRAAEWEMSFYRRQRETPVPQTDNAASETRDDGRLDRATLEHFVRSRHADANAVSITEFSAVPGGYGKQTTRFTLRDAAGEESQLIARKSDHAPMVLNGAFLINHEYALVQAVSASRYPAPTPLWLGTGIDGTDADFYIMSCLPGRIPGSFLGGPEGGISEALLLDVATQLARLHVIPLSTFSDYIVKYDDRELLAEGPAGGIESCYRRAIKRWREYGEAVEHLPSPYFHYLLDWLLRNLPQDSRPPVLVHGDFNVHNLLVADEKVTGVLDWECAMFGSPEQDLAYIQPHISQHIAWDKFLARYHEAGGPAIDASRLPFYMAFSMMRLHLGMNHGLLNLQTGANPDIRYAMIELAFAPQMMEMGLASTLATQ